MDEHGESARTVPTPSTVPASAATASPAVPSAAAPSPAVPSAAAPSPAVPSAAAPPPVVSAAAASSTVAPPRPTPGTVRVGPAPGRPAGDDAAGDDGEGTRDHAVDEAMTTLAALDGAPLREHVAVFDAVHTALQDRLADTEG